MCGWRVKQYCTFSPGIDSSSRATGSTSCSKLNIRGPGRSAHCRSGRAGAGGGGGGGGGGRQLGLVRTYRQVQASKCRKAGMCMCMCRHVQAACWRQTWGLQLRSNARHSRSVPTHVSLRRVLVTETPHTAQRFFFCQLSLHNRLVWERRGSVAQAAGQLLGCARQMVKRTGQTPRARTLHALRLQHHGSRKPRRRLLPLCNPPHSPRAAAAPLSA